MRRLITVVVVAACGDGGHSPDAPPLDTPDATIVALTVRKDGAPTNASLVAVQDGDGGWTAVAGTAGAYMLPVTTGRYGAFVACAPLAMPGSLTLLFATTAESTSFEVNCGFTMPVQHQLSGTITGATGHTVSIYGLHSTTSTTTASYSFQTDSGTHDYGYILRSGNTSPDTFVLDRGLAVDADLVHDVDFATGFMPEIHTVTATNTGNDFVVISGFFRTAGGTSIVTGPGPAQQMVPAAKQAAGDIHVISAAAANAATAAVRSGLVFLAAPASATVDLFGLLDPPTVFAAATTPALRLHVDFTPLAGTNAHVFTATQSGGSAWTAFASTGWLGGATAFEWPDLSGVSGWSAPWGLVAGTSTTWSLQGTDSNRGLTGLLGFREADPNANLDGLVIRTSQRAGTLP